MRKVLVVFSLFLLAASQTFAAHSEGKACGSVAQSCVSAGYKDVEGDKNFWFGCMRPLLLGEKVEGVVIDEPTLKECRTDKIADLKKDLKEIQDYVNEHH